jgi:Putative Ig domain
VKWIGFWLLFVTAVLACIGSTGCKRLPSTVKVATATLPNGVLNTAYPATTLQASGGTSPYSWTISAGNLPAGLSLASSGVISGTPTAVGTANFTVHVADSEKFPATGDAKLSITVTTATTLKGDFAFEFSGFNSGGQVVVAGSFTADGMGDITNGVEDLNTMAGPPKNQIFAGTYTLGSDNRGQLIFSSLTGSPTYDFAVDSTGAHGRLIEFDSSGIRGSGQLELRTLSTCAFNTITGNYAFGVAGQETAIGGVAAGPAVVVGSFLATPPASSGGQGTIGLGEDDFNTPAAVTPPGTPDKTLSGTFQTTSEGTRCTMSLLASIGSMTFSVYPVSSTESFLVETGQVNSTTSFFLTAGKMLVQSGAPFVGATGSTFTATSVAGLAGQFLSGTTYVPDLALVSLTGTGSSAYTMSAIENRAGTVTTFSPAGSFVSFDQNGRLDTGVSSQIALVLYMIGPNEAFCIGNTLGDPFFGFFEPQSAGPFTASNLDGSFALGTSAPATAPLRDISGTVALASTSSTAGAVAGTQDQSTSSSNVSAQVVTGTYSGLSSTAGSGVLALTVPGVLSGDFLVVSPTKIVLMSVTSSDADPILMFLGNCETTCGED